VIQDEHDLRCAASELSPEWLAPAQNGPARFSIREMNARQSVTIEPTEGRYNQNLNASCSCFFCFCLISLPP